MTRELDLPLQLIAHVNGKTAIFKGLEDLSAFLDKLELPTLPLPDWPVKTSLQKAPMKVQ